MAKTRQEIFEDYDGFVEKFKPKKTTDDCYTPQPIYDGLLEYIRRNVFDFHGAEIVRPFYPGGDYRNFDYPDNCVVIDNPPFSILTQVLDFYIERNILFWLFAPSLTLFSAPRPSLTYVCAHCNITYENGAVVRTSFVTNFYPEDCIVVADGDLFMHIDAINDEIQRANRKTQQKIYYPDCLITSALLGRVVSRGVSFKVGRDSAYFVRKLDDMARYGKGVFGGGYLLSERAAAERAAAERAAAERAAAERAAAERAAAERAAAERAAAERFNLSDREINIIKALK